MPCRIERRELSNGCAPRLGFCRQDRMEWFHISGRIPFVILRLLQACNTIQSSLGFSQCPCNRGHGVVFWERSCSDPTGFVSAASQSANAVSGAGCFREPIQFTDLRDTNGREKGKWQD